MKISEKWVWFAGFTAVFAALAAHVFWGTWSADFAPVMPDDSVWHPIAYSDQLAGFFKGLLSGNPFSPVKVFWDGALPQYGMQEFKYAAGLFFAATGLAFFLRERGLSRLASYGAGLFLGFCGYWTTLFSAGHGGWFVIMGPMVFAFAFMDRVAKAGRLRDGILLGACVGWGSSHQADLFLLFAVFLTVYGVCACVRERAFPWKAALAALGFFFVIGAPGIYSAFTGALASRDQQIEESKRSSPSGGKGAAANVSDAEKKKADDEARWVFVTNWSMPPEDTLEFFIPRVHGDTSCPMTLQLGRAAGKDVQPYTGRLGRPLNAPRGNYRQHSLYVGWVTCLLALVGALGGLGGLGGLGCLVGLGGLKGQLSTPKSQLPTAHCPLPATRLPRSLDILFFLLAALVFWIFSLGRFCEPVYRLVFALPFGDYLRAPVKWHHLTEFCLVILAGYGIDALWGFLRARGCGGKIAFALVACLVLFGATDLARQAARFCAPIDIRIVTCRNAAADEVIRRGKGTVCDLVEGGSGLLAWSFAARGLGMTGDLRARDVRFVLTGTEQVKRNAPFAAWLGQNAAPAGTYVLTQAGIRSAPPGQSNAALYQVIGVPPPPPPLAPAPVAPLVRTLGILSLIGTLAAVAAVALEVLTNNRRSAA